MAHVYVCMPSHFSHIRLFGTLWIVARQTPVSIGFLKQEYWSGLPSSPPGFTSPNRCLDLRRSRQEVASRGGFSQVKGRESWCRTGLPTVNFLLDGFEQKISTAIQGMYVKLINISRTSWRTVFSSETL